MKNPNLEEILVFLGATGDDKSLAKVGNRRARSVTKYYADLASNLAAENGSTVVSGTKKITGQTNFENGNVIPKNTYLVVVGVRVLFDTPAAAAALNTRTWKNEAPANWKNGEMTITQSGQGVLFNSSITDVTNWKASTGNDDDFREVQPFIIRPESDFDINFKLAAGDTAHQAFKYELRCIEMFLESNG